MADQSDAGIKRTSPPPTDDPVKPAQAVKAEQREQNRANQARETWAPQRANQLDDWLAIGPDGTVTVFSGKVELGTGVRTALAQIAADELDVPLDRILMVMGDTAITPNEGYTAGSKTIQIGGVALREASAEARQALLEMASDRLDATIDELAVNDGVVSVRERPERSVSYAELIGGKRFNREVSGKVKPKRPEEYRIVGKPFARLDLPYKFTGQPSFIQDMRLPGILHGRIIRPPSPGATLVSLDENSVWDIPGVQVVHIRNYVAVVAEREEDARRAATQLEVTWQEKPTLPSMDKLFDWICQQPTTDKVVVDTGNVDRAMPQAAKRISATYYQPYQNHASIGPSCGVAHFEKEEVKVWAATQGVYPLRSAIADLLELAPEKVHVIHVEGAGCYGQNGSDDAAADAAVLSRAVGRPVRVQWTREEEFAWEPKSPAMVMEVSGGLDQSGQIVAWDYQVWTPPHTTRAVTGNGLLAGQLMTGERPPARTWLGGGDRNAPTDYQIANQRVQAHWLAYSPVRASSMRSLGGAANTFANESFMDELAAAAHRDPLEFRLAHLSDPRAQAVLRAAAEQAHWEARPARAARGEGFSAGQGVSFARYENAEAYVGMIAQVEVNASSGEVRVRRIVAAHDCGLIINPDGLRNQIEGNVVQAVSRALKEEVRFDETRILSLDWESYPILTFSELPDVEVILLNHPEQPAVGAGEPSTITVAAAIANAIYDATGARVRQVPFTPVRVREALGR